METLSNVTPDERAEALLAAACAAAPAWARTSRAERARVLVTVADALDAAADRLVPLAQHETHLPEGRLRGELTRTTFQFRFLGESVAEGGYLDVRVDHPDQDWPMGAPRPDLRRTAVPLGPVLVFAASNFPFAFSVAGGDTAAALAAGCPVIAKPHEGHLELSHATAEVVGAALTSAGAPDGLFAMVEGPEPARAVLTHPALKAGAFTGSIPAGRALFDIAQSRTEPIPFYGELGSVNPVFVTEEAAEARGDEITSGFVGSFTLGAGQFCTKPGIILVPEGSDLVDRLVASAMPEPATMLNDRIAAGHERVRDALSDHPKVRVLAEGDHARVQDGAPAPMLLAATAADLLADPDGLLVECFGPTGLVLTYRDRAELLEVANTLDGQLTATICGEDTETDVVASLAEVLVTKAGRLLWNQWPTGVSVTHAQQHGGPYPATTAPTTTSVGTAAIQRFIRPVAWQGFPDHLLPDELREEPTAATPRQVDGTRDLGVQA